MWMFSRLFAFMNTLSVFHIYNVLSHSKEILFSDSKTASLNMFSKRYKSVHFTHLSLYIYIWSGLVDLWLALAYEWQVHKPLTRYSYLVRSSGKAIANRDRCQSTYIRCAMCVFTVCSVHTYIDGYWCTFHSITNWWNCVQLSYSY